MMRAVRLRTFDGVGGVDVDEVDEPAAADDRVAVRVAFAALGPWDAATTHGAFTGAGGTSELPQVLGWDFSGTVESAGPATSGFTAGERVLGFTPQPWSGIGALAEVISVPASMIAALPDGADLTAASAVPVSALTALLALNTASVGSGDGVLVVGATGAVGGFVTQLASARGARVVASVSAGAAGEARRLGARDVVDRSGDVAAQVRALVDGGVDVVVDVVGPPVWEACMGALRDGGRLVTTIPAQLPDGERGITLRSVSVQPDAQQLAALAQAFADGQLESRIAEVVPLDRAADALARIDRGQAPGKIVVAVSDATGTS
jgi:NADPH:quinone reductase